MYTCGSSESEMEAAVHAYLGDTGHEAVMCADCGDLVDLEDSVCAAGEHGTVCVGCLR
jgi:hypothetical protein